MIRYAAVNQNCTWHEVGDHILPGKEPAFIFGKSFKRRLDNSPAKCQIAFEMNGMRSCFYHCYEVWRQVLTEF